MIRKLLSATIGAGMLLAAGAQADEDANVLGSQHAVKHVLLISVDGLHALDLSNFVASHPDSALAVLSRHGVTYPNSTGSTPS